jgi:hypothetical protein
VLQDPQSDTLANRAQSESLILYGLKAFVQMGGNS